MECIQFDPELHRRNIFINVATLQITIHSRENFHVKSSTQREEPLKQYTQTFVASLQSAFSLATIKDQPIIKKYRKFYSQKLHIDPTKTRPSSEALIRRILKKGSLPSISPFVDAYNWASATTFISVGAYDLTKLHLPIIFRLTHDLPVEEFIPIGGEKKILPPKVLVTSDTSRQILCRYPYRDAHATKVEPESSNILIIAYGVEGITRGQLEQALSQILTNLHDLSEHNVFQFSNTPLQYFTNF